MSDSIPAPADPEATAAPPARPAGGVITATPAQGLLLDAHQRQLRALGAELRQARKARGLSLAALAERLRLGQEQLQALEEGDTRRLPELVFVIAQLRRVAGALQLDLGDQLAQLRARPPAESSAPSKPSEPAHAVARQRPFAAPASGPEAHAAAAQASRAEAMAPPRWRLAAGLAIPVVALTAAVAFGLLRRGEPRAPEANSALSNHPSGSLATPTTPDTAPQAPSQGGGDLSSRSTVTPPPVSGGLVSKDNPETPASEAATTTAQGAPSGTSHNANGKGTPSPSARAPVAASAPAATTATSPALPTATAGARSSAAAADAVSLNLQAAEASWLEVRSGSGEVLFRGFFSGARRFPLQAGLRLLAGRPDLIEVSGTGQPTRKLGPISDVVWYSFAAPTPGQPAPLLNQPATER
jgi:cytoskeletal protein RodZ